MITLLILFKRLSTCASSLYSVSTCIKIKSIALSNHLIQLLIKFNSIRTISNIGYLTIELYSFNNRFNRFNRLNRFNILSLFSLISLSTSLMNLFFCNMFNSSLHRYSYLIFISQKSFDHQPSLFIDFNFQSIINFASHLQTRTNHFLTVK